jgi:transcriptional regulator with XRE-family HTH domain
MIFFGINLKYLRNISKLNQDKIAKQLDFTKTQWSNYEKGTSYPKFLDFINIASYFNLPLDDLVFKDLSELKNNSDTNTKNETDSYKLLMELNECRKEIIELQKQLLSGQGNEAVEYKHIAPGKNVGNVG